MLLEKIWLSCEKFKWTSSLCLSINYVICGIYLFAHTDLKFHSVFVQNILLLFKVIYIRMFIMLCKFVHVNAIVFLFLHASVCAYQCVYCVDDRACHLLLTTIFPTYLKQDLTLNPYHGNLPRLSGRQSPWVLLSLVVELFEDTSAHSRYPGVRVKKKKNWVFMLLQPGLQVLHQLNYHSSPRNYFSYQA